MYSPADLNRAIFEHPRHWDGTTRVDALHQGRNRLLGGLIPPDTQEILDVGCGEGAFAEVAAQGGRLVLGVDRSFAAASVAPVPVAVADVTRLPARDRAFDLVSCIEVLEHLDSAVLAEAARELSRVSRRYLLVSVPWREQLINQMAKCGGCGELFHAWGHARSFRSARQIGRLFPGWRTVATAGYGTQQEFRLPGFPWLRKHALGRWTWERSTVCPACRGTDPAAPPSLPKPLRRLMEGLEWRLAYDRHPWWLMVTLKRTE